MTWNEEDHPRDEHGRFGAGVSAFVNKYDQKSAFQILAGAKRAPLSVRAHPDVSKDHTDAVSGALARVAAKIEAAGFGRILHGEIHVVPELQQERHGEYVGGAKDHIQISATSDTARLEHTIAHELGHRYEAQFLNSGTKADFDKLIHGEDVTAHLSHADREIMADHYIHEQRSMRGDPVEPREAPAGYDHFMAVDRQGDHSDLLDRFDRGDNTSIPGLREHIGMLHDRGTVHVPAGRTEPLAVSNYERHDPREQFAEAFAHHTLGKSLPSPIKRFMEKL